MAMTRMTPDDVRIGALLAEACARTHTAHKALAYTVGVDPALVSRWMSGEVHLPAYMVRRFESPLRETFAALFARDLGVLAIEPGAIDLVRQVFAAFFGTRVSAASGGEGASLAAPAEAVRRAA